MKNLAKQISSSAIKVTLPKSEWYFEQVPSHLVGHCWLWEFCRELYLRNEELRAAVEAYWRKINKEDDWKRHVECDGEWPQIPASDIFAEKNLRWRKPVLEDDDDPDHRWRVLTRSEIIKIRDSLQNLPGWDGIIGYATAEDDVVLRLMDFDEVLGLGKAFPEVLSFACKKVAEDNESTFRVDLNKSDVELVKEFRQLLKELRPVASPPKRPKGRPSESERKQLKMLGAKRLLDFYGTQDKVIKAVKLSPYGDSPSTWSKAKTEADEALSNLVLIVQCQE